MEPPALYAPRIIDTELGELLPELPAIALSFTVRLALLPLGLRLARRSLETQRKLRELEPALARRRQRHAADQARLLDETRAVHHANGVQMMPKGSVLTLAVQLPLGVGLYQAIAGSLGPAGRFLWVVDLARPDRRRARPVEAWPR
ncbi:MAG: YidC/Oxa1 family membrane protein insertase [Gemmatimonadaceae bacterium]